MRGEGNHKIPGSFAPENMEKTGAERVKYSLACQHEDEIPIKFVPYAQKCPTVLCTFAVALRKESVDRNKSTLINCNSNFVALRKESVDRNFDTVQVIIIVMESLSARRAWIEIPTLCCMPKTVTPSLSARRAWIEILATRLADMSAAVALRKESVDRNTYTRTQSTSLSASLSARRAWIEMCMTCSW